MKFLRSYDFFLGVVMVFMVTLPVLAEKDDKNKDLGVKGSFVNMLKNIVHANEDRMHALKRLTELQEYMVTKTRPFFSEFDTEESSENENAVIALLNAMKLQNNTFRRTSHEDEQTKSELPVLYTPVNYYINNFKASHKNTKPDIEDTSKSDKNGDIIKVGVTSDIKNGKRKLAIEVEDTLVQDSRKRNGFILKCAKEGRKLCKEACKNAYRSFCRVFSCSKRAKRKLRIECKYSCNAKFKTNTYSDDDIE